MYLQFDKITKEVLNISESKMPVVTGLQMIEFETDLTIEFETVDSEGFVLEIVQFMPTDVNDLKTMLLEDKEIKFDRSIQTVPYLGKVYDFSQRSRTFIVGLYAQAKFSIIENDSTWSVTQITTDGTVLNSNAASYVAFSDSVSLHVRNLMALHLQENGLIMSKTTEAELYQTALGI